MARRGRPPIQDEFTNLPISRSRKCMLRNLRDGKCPCGRPRCPGSERRCEKCLLSNRAYKRVKMGYRPRVPGGVGHPQLIPDKVEFPNG